MAALKARMCSCFDIMPRLQASYFWPPRKNKIEHTKGVMLILETVKNNVSLLRNLIKKVHSDTLPFLGVLEIDVEQSYATWVRNEIRS